MTFPCTCKTCDKKFRSQKEDSIICYACALEIFAGSNASMLEGKTSVNDLARSQLMKKIQEGNLTGIIFWLKHNDPDFNPRIAIELKREEPLSKEQVMEVAVAMKHIGLAGILESEKALLKKFKESPAGPIEIVNRERWADAYRRYKEEESGMQMMKKLDSDK